MLYHLHKCQWHLALAVCLALIAVLGLNGGKGRAWAHPPDGNLPPTKAESELKLARTFMDGAKLLLQQGRYACCIEAPANSKEPGCDLCARENGSCACGKNLKAGKGVCGECLSAWQSGRGKIIGVTAKQVKLFASPNQKLDSIDSTSPLPPELTQARDILNGAKRTLVGEGR